MIHFELIRTYQEGNIVKCMSGLFEIEPMNWGLRGDPYLWKEMKEYVASTCLPKSKRELEFLVRNAFK